MTIQRARRTNLARLALSAIGAFAGLGILIPVILVRLAGWPLPGSWPDVGEMLTAIQQQNIPDGFVVGAFACIAWIIWAQLAWAFLWEAVVNTRRISSGLDVRPAPFVASAINQLVARVASGTVAVSMLVTSPVAAATLPTLPTAAPVETPSGVSTARQPVKQTQKTVAPTTTMWQVALGDTAWSIAETALGDGSRFGEIAQLNPWLSSPRQVTVGLTLVLPEGAQVPADRQPDETVEPKTAGAAEQQRQSRAAATALAAVGGEHFAGPVATSGLSMQLVEPPTDGFLAEQDVVIVNGDHLWGLSEQRLESVAGHTPSNLEILEHVNDVIDLNHDIVEDPDLIFPGEVFTFPQIGARPAPDLETPPDPVTPNDPAQAPDDPTPESPSAVPEATSVLDLDPIATSVSNRSIVPYLLCLAGSTVLATSLLAVSRAKRRRRESLGADVCPELDTELEHVLTTAANLPLIRWAGQELSTVVTGLTINAAPQAVEVSESGIEVLWDGSAADAPHPWEATDGGVAWRLLYDADAPIPADELAPAIPALVTVGARPGEGVVLLDLEALGSVSVSGDQCAVQDLIRSMALELATGSDLARSDVVTVGFDVEATEDVPRIKTAKEDEALALLTTTVAQYDEMIASAGAEHSFDLRCATGPGPEAIVVVLSAESCSRIDDFTKAVGRRRGGAVVIVGDAKSSNGTIVVSADGSTAIEPLGLKVQAPAVPVEVAAAVGGLFAPWSSALETETADVPVVSLEHEQIKPAQEPNRVIHSEEPDDDWLSSDLVDLENIGAELGEQDAWERPNPPLLIRLLGEPSASGFSLSSRQLGLLALIASKAGEVSAEFVLDHLWADQSNARSRKTLWNLESATRSAVGPELLPHSPKNQPLRTPAITDVSIFEALVERAGQVSSTEAIELLAEALDLVQGPPFDNCQFEWARSIGLYEPARQMIEKASLRLCDLALEGDDIDTARRSIDQGLLGLGVNEPLYRARMRIDAASGDAAAVLQTYRELDHRLQTLFGDAEPSAATKRLRDELMNDKAA